MESFIKKYYAPTQDIIAAIGTKQQYRWLNALKTLALLNLIAYYFIYSSYVLQGADPAWGTSSVAMGWQQAIIASLVFLCGMTFTQGSNYFHWGLLLIAVGILTAIATSFLASGVGLHFGLASFLGLSYLVIRPLESWLKKAPGSCGLILSAIGYALTKELASGIIVWQGRVIGHVPDVFYSPLTAWLGLPPENFASLEYVPFLPYIFLFVAGFYSFRFLQEHDRGKRYLELLK